MNVQELTEALDKIDDKDSVIVTVSEDGTEQALVGVARSVYVPLVILVTEKSPA